MERIDRKIRSRCKYPECQVKEMKNIEINDAVMHVPEGVCKVTEIIERDLSRYGIRQYYVLVPVYDRGTKIYIPTDAGSDKMKSLPEKDEVL